MISRYNNNKSIFKQIDLTVLILYVLLIIVGAISIYAASYDFDNASMFKYSEFSGKQFIWIGLSFILGTAILLIDDWFYETYAYLIYGVIILFLILTIFIAPDIKGSHSWIVLGPVSFQPAEFAKFATALALGKLFNSYNFRLNSKAINYVKALTIMLLPVILIILQNETGSALTFMALFFVLFREGMSGIILLAGLDAVIIFVVALKYTSTVILGMPGGEFIVLILILVNTLFMVGLYCKSFLAARNILFIYAGCTAIFVILYLLGITDNGRYLLIGTLIPTTGYLVYELFKRDAKKFIVTILFTLGSVGFLYCTNVTMDSLGAHQQMRIKVALGIEQDLRGAGYNVNQSKIAIGSGGFAGKGFLNGTQTKLNYVPEHHTDFIFCTIGEEEGFIGTSLVIIAFIVLILRIIKIAERQRTAFARVYAYCVASYLIFHFGVNIGMVIGLCPVIGIPLPFFSYGGSSLWGFTILLFILLRLDASRTEHNY